jgi:hypothetical protein
VCSPGAWRRLRVGWPGPEHRLIHGESKLREPHDVRIRVLDRCPRGRCNGDCGVQSGTSRPDRRA